MIYLSDDSSGRNAVQTEPNHPVRVALTFGKTFVKFIVSVKDPEEPNEVTVNAADVLMEGKACVKKTAAIILYFFRSLASLECV